MLQIHAKLWLVIGSVGYALVISGCVNHAKSVCTPHAGDRVLKIAEEIPGHYFAVRDFESYPLLTAKEADLRPKFTGVLVEKNNKLGRSRVSFAAGKIVSITPKEGPKTASLGQLKVGDQLAASVHELISTDSWYIVDVRSYRFSLLLPRDASKLHGFSGVLTGRADGSNTHRSDVYRIKDGIIIGVSEERSWD